MKKATYQQQLCHDFHQEIQYYYYNGEHIYPTPNRERDYERMGPLLWDFILMMMASAMPDGPYGEYDEQKMKESIVGILDMVGQTMLETAEKVGDDTTPKVLAEVRKWVKKPS